MSRTIITLALRGMLRRPYVAIVSLIAISVTLATLLVGTAVLEHALAPAPPMSNASRLVVLSMQRLSSETQTATSGLGWRVLEPIALGLESAEEVAVIRSTRRIEIWHGDAQRIGALKSANAALWRAFDFRFVAGAPWGERDDQEGRRVAILAADTARTLFGGANPIGATIDVDGRSHEVIGVVGNVSISHRFPHAEVWVPLTSARTDAWRMEARDDLAAAILVRRDRTPDDTKAEIAARVAALAPPVPFEKVEVWADTPLEALSRNLFGPDEAHLERLVALLALGCLGFMALPALNLVTLSMSRSLERASEIGVRRAYGATRLQLLGQLLAETLISTMVGAILALGLAAVSLDLLERSGALPGTELTLGPLTLATAGILATVFALLSGTLPAWRMARMHPVEALSGRLER